MNKDIQLIWEASRTVTHKLKSDDVDVEVPSANSDIIQLKDWLQEFLSQTSMKASQAEMTERMTKQWLAVKELAKEKIRDELRPAKIGRQGVPRGTRMAKEVEELSQLIKRVDDYVKLGKVSVKQADLMDQAKAGMAESQREMDLMKKEMDEGGNPFPINVSREQFAEIQVKLGNWLNEKGAETVVVPKRSIGALDFHESILDDMGVNSAAIRLEIVTDLFEATGKVSSREPTQDIFKIYSGDPSYFSEEQLKVIYDLSPTKHWKEDPNRPNRSPEAITILSDERRGSSIVYGGLVALATGADGTHGTGADLTGPPEVRPPITTEVITEYVNGLLSEYLAGEANKGYKEGEKKGQTVDVRKRNKTVIERAKEENITKYGALTCETCFLQPANQYYVQGQTVSPTEAKSVIEGHHKKGVQEGEITTDDIQCLCNNCHIYETQFKI